MRQYRRNRGRGWLIVAGVLFILAVVVGIFLSVTIPQILDPLQKDAPTHEYIILVAYLYDREGLMQNVQERLGKLGDKGSDKAVSALAISYPKNNPDKPREIQSLGQLAKGLEISRPASGGEPASGGGFPGGLVALVLIIMVMLAIFIVSVASGRLQPIIASIQGRSSPGASSRSGYIRRPYRTGPVETTMHEPEVEEAEDADITEPEPKNGIAGLIQQSQRLLRKLNEQASTFTRRSRLTTSGVPVTSYGDELEAPEWAEETGEGESTTPDDVGRLLQSIQMSYVAGQDVYHEVYPLLEQRTGVMIGTCGLSPGFALEPNHPDDYHAMVVWLHDYRTPHRLYNAVFLSRGLCYGARPPELEHWLRTQHIQTVLPAEAGRSMSLDAATLRARVAVLQVETYPPNNPSGGISTLELRFDISQKGVRPRRRIGPFTDNL
jgi:hypothetical protein